jgi:3-isopropylmalate/(R)-2-methylmalate dehydratase large subunit
MNSTIIQKILASHSGRKEVEVGEFVTAKIDAAMIPEGLLEVHETAVKAGLKNGIPKIWDPSKVITGFDHTSPISNERTAQRVKKAKEITKQYGCPYYDINEGIMHQVMLDHGHVLPGSLIVGKDSHSTTYGALNAAGIPIGASEMVYVLAKGELWFKVPETIAIEMHGELRRYSMSKDIFLHITGKYTTELAQYKSIEWRGDGASKLSMDGRVSMSEMSIELGAKCGIFEADKATIEYLDERAKGPFTSVKADKDAAYEKVLAIDVTQIEPMVAKPHFVGNVAPVSEVEGTHIDQAFVGTCSNGRLEDLRMAARIVKGKKANPNTKFIVTPASAEIYRKAATEGLLQILSEAGAMITNPSCGACTGFAGVLAEGETCLAAAPRNFMGRMGSNKANIYLGSPATVAVSALRGEITDPRRFIK